MSDEQNQTAILSAIAALSLKVESLDKSLAAIDKGLAVNTLETTNVKEQLTKLNGKVATHEASLGILTQAQALYSQAKTDKEKAASNWQGKLLDKIVWIGLGILGIVIYTLLIKTHTLAPLTTIGGPAYPSIQNIETK